MIHVVASVSLNPGTKDFYLKQVAKVIPTIHAEQGCIEYQVVEDLDMELPPQVLTEGEGVTIIEKWQSEADLRAHLGAPHMAEYRKSVETAVNSVKLQVFKPAV